MFDHPWSTPQCAPLLMTEEQIRIRRERARRQRRVVGAIRMALFIVLVSVIGLSLAAIGNAGNSDPAPRATPAADSAAADPAPAPKKATATKTAPKPVPRTSVSRKAPSHKAVQRKAVRRSPAPRKAAGRRSAARAATRSAVHIDLDPIMVTHRSRPRASAPLPYTGVGELAQLALLAALVALAGMLVQIAGQPLPTRQSSR